LHPDGSGAGKLRAWTQGKLAKSGDDIGAFWSSFASDLQITEWRCASMFVFSPIGPGAAIRRGTEWRATDRRSKLITENGLDGTLEVPFLELAPNWFDYRPREVCFFKDWEDGFVGMNPRL
jgi:hypothetical protein